MRLPGCSTASAIRSPSFPQDLALSERAELGMAPDGQGTGHHGGQVELTKALAVSRSVEDRHGLPEAVDSSMIVALGLVGASEAQVRQGVQDDISAGRGECVGALGGGDGWVIRAHEEEMD